VHTFSILVFYIMAGCQRPSALHFLRHPSLDRRRAAKWVVSVSICSFINFYAKRSLGKIILLFNYKQIFK